jgi:hypothetical protein
MAPSSMQGLWRAFSMPGPIVVDFIPFGLGRNKDVRLRPLRKRRVQRAQTHSHDIGKLVAPAVNRRAADRAEQSVHTLGRLEIRQQLSALGHFKTRCGNRDVRRKCRSVCLSTPRAMAVNRWTKITLDLVVHRLTQAASFVHGRTFLARLDVKAARPDTAGGRPERAPGWAQCASLLELRHGRIAHKFSSFFNLG